MNKSGKMSTISTEWAESIDRRTIKKLHGCGSPYKFQHDACQQQQQHNTVHNDLCFKKAFALVPMPLLVSTGTGACLIYQVYVIKRHALLALKRDELCSRFMKQTTIH